METVIEIFFQVLYNNRDISVDLSKYLLGLTYVDNVDGESDEISLELEDVDGLWRNGWYPDKGAKLDVTIGYEDIRMPCGVFEIDEIEHNGPPDTVTIKGLAVGISGNLRTKKSYAHENKSLRQIAQTIAANNKLTLVGNIEDIRIARVTQNRETDLSFLKRIACDYGYLFSVRDRKLVFTSIFGIEDVPAVSSIDRLDVASYNFRDKTSQTFKNSKVSYHNPDEKRVVERTFDFKNERNADGYAYSQIATGDTLEIRTKAETTRQAELKGKAALHRKNSQQQGGRLEVIGNPLLVAGNNFELTGFGKISGKWHIEGSTHAMSRSGGYSTSLQVKRVGVGDPSKFDSVKREEARTLRAQAPSTASVVSARVENRQNADRVRFTPITNVNP